MMASSSNSKDERPQGSSLLTGMHRERLLALRSLDPGRKMQIAFSLSIEARKLMIAGLKAQGFSEPEIRAILRTRRK